MVPNRDRDIALTRLVAKIAKSTNRTEVLELSFQFAAAQPASATTLYTTGYEEIGYKAPEAIVIAKVREVTASDPSLTLAALMEIADLSQPAATEPRSTGSGLSDEARAAWREVLASDYSETDLARLNTAYETVHRASTKEMKNYAAFTALMYAEKVGSASLLARTHSCNVAIFAAQTHNQSLSKEAARIADTFKRAP